MVKHTQTIRQQKPTNCLSVTDHFKGLALKGSRLLIEVIETIPKNPVHPVITCSKLTTETLEQNVK